MSGSRANDRISGQLGFVVKYRCHWLHVPALQPPRHATGRGPRRIEASACVMKTCESHRVKGWFYFPETPTYQVPGILTWSQDKGADLELIGGLSPNSESERTKEMTWEASQIVGAMPPSTIYAVSGPEKISLWGAERRNCKAGIGGKVQEESWHAEWVCIGSHIPAVNARVMCGFTIALDDLYYLTGDGRFCVPQWAPIEGIERPGEQQDDGTFLLPYVLPVIGGHRSGCARGSIENFTYMIDTYATRPWISPATEAIPTLKLDFMTNRRRHGPSIELSVDACARIAAVDDSSGSAEELLRSMKPLLDLMSLATFDTPGVEWMRAQTVEGEEVSLLCRTGHQAKPDVASEAGGLVFTLDDISLNSFLTTRQRLTAVKQARYAWNVVVGLIGHSPYKVEEHISQVLAAAEGFHRWCLDGGKNVNLEMRLKDLHSMLSSGVKGRLQLDVDMWAVWASWARNHVDHGGAEKHRDISDFYQLKIIADSVRLVTYLVVLQEFGVPNEKLEEALSNHPRLKIIAERCAEVPALPSH